MLVVPAQLDTPVVIWIVSPRKHETANNVAALFKSIDLAETIAMMAMGTQVALVLRGSRMRASIHVVCVIDGSLRFYEGTIAGTTIQ